MQGQAINSIVTNRSKINIEKRDRDFDPKDIKGEEDEDYYISHTWDMRRC